MSDPFINMIPLKSRPISLAMALDHFGLSGTFIDYICSWYFTVSGKITALMSPVWIVTSPVALFVSIQYSPVWCNIVLVGAGVGICLGGAILVIWLEIILWTFRRLELVLYLCNSWTLMVHP